MDVLERDAGDSAVLEELVDAEPSAKQRDRYREALFAIQAEQTEEIVRMLRRSRGFVQRWDYAYREGGIQMLLPGKSKGRPVLLPCEKQAEFLARIDAGPTQADGVCAFTCHDARRILEEELGPSTPTMARGVSCTGWGTRRCVHSHATRTNTPRPSRGSSRAPPFVQSMKGACPDKTVQVWFQDEARFGQQGTTTRKRARKGSRPWAIKHAKYKWLYLYDAVCPETGNSAAMISPWVNMDATNMHLKWISDSVGPEDHSVLVLDRAGWHVSKELAVPPNITLRYLPPYSPELNPRGEQVGLHAEPLPVQPGSGRPRPLGRRGHRRL